MELPGSDTLDVLAGTLLCGGAPQNFGAKVTSLASAAQYCGLDVHRTPPPQGTWDYEKDIKYPTFTWCHVKYEWTAVMVNLQTC